MVRRSGAARGGVVAQFERLHRLTWPRRRSLMVLMCYWKRADETRRRNDPAILAYAGKRVAQFDAERAKESQARRCRSQAEESCVRVYATSPERIHFLVGRALRTESRPYALDVTHANASLPSKMISAACAWVRHDHVRPGHGGSGRRIAALPRRRFGSCAGR